MLPSILLVGVVTTQRNKVWSLMRSSSSSSSSYLFVCLVLFGIVINHDDVVNGGAVVGPVPCQSHAECEIAVGFGSVCLLEGGGGGDGNNNNKTSTNNICSNPFAKGCLATMLPNEWKKNKSREKRMRVCNSDDPPEAVGLVCHEADSSAFDYQEIRIFSQNWDSVTFEYWILQIVLSEILDIPTTIEHGIPGPRSNFYDPESPFDFGKAFDWDALRRPSYLPNGDCRLAKTHNDLPEEEEYESCAHFFGQRWDGGEDVMAEMVAEGYIDPLSSLGMVGRNGWYVPKFTVERDPTLMSYLGMGGEANRHKLADMFRRPTTWSQYCEEVSPNNCQTDDGIAKGPPPPPSEEEEEGKRYFVEGQYIGHFRKTDANDCETNPRGCTGHLIAYPCFWESFVIQQLHHLEIALEVDHEATVTDHYYSDMLDMFLAANATKSNIIFQWWNPEAHHQRYMGTDMELQRVTLPPPTADCIHNRADLVGDDRCGAKYEDLIGTADGSCDQESLNIRKLIVTTLHPDPEIPEALRSPSYEVLQRFTLSELHFGELFAYQQSKRTLREAVCTWVVDNLELVQDFVPRKFPRIVKEDDQSSNPLFWTAIIAGGVAGMTVIATALMVHKRRGDRVLRQAQIEFLWLLLAGAFLVSLGAIATALPPTNAVCLVDVWFINIGYTLELVPLIVKIAAINTLLQAAKKMRKIQLKTTHLFGAVFAIMALVVTYLCVWTAVDPPRKLTNYDLTDTVTDDGEYVVFVNHHCGSESKLWWTVSVAWNVLLLFGATVLAFQTRKSRLSESQNLVMLIYSHLGFVVLRLITLFLPSEINPLLLARCRSIVFSFDTILGMVIYFGPKLFHEQISRSRTSTRNLASRFGMATVTGVSYAPGPSMAPSSAGVAEYSRADAQLPPKPAESNSSSLNMDKQSQQYPVDDDNKSTHPEEMSPAFPVEEPTKDGNKFAELLSCSATYVRHFALTLPKNNELGVSVASSPCDYGVRIETIQEDSPLYGVADPGDKIIGYNGAFDADELVKLLTPTASADSAATTDGFDDEEAAKSQAEPIRITLQSTC